MEFRNRLSELRGDMSQAEFASRLGLTQQNYWKYENGKQGMRSDLIERVCDECCCTAEWLLMMERDSLRGMRDAVAGKCAQGLPDDERELLDVYRSVTPAGKRAILANARGVAGEYAKSDDDGASAKAV